MGMYAALLASAMVLAQPPESAAAREQAVKAELQRLQGGWQFESLEQGDKKFPASVLKERVFFVGRSIFLIRQGLVNEQMGQLNLDPKKSPRALNAVIPDGPRKGDVMLGIYELDGDTLKVCLDTRGDSRPKEFKSDNDAVMNFTCKHVKSESTDDDIIGKYRAEAVDLGGKHLIADASIERVGDAYQVVYSKKGIVMYIGVGLRMGKVLSLSWISDGQVGVTIYQIEGKNKLVGQYVQMAGPGVRCDEVLTRVEED